jgi:hypothetical protein
VNNLRTHGVVWSGIPNAALPWTVQSGDSHLLPKVEPTFRALQVFVVIDEICRSVAPRVYVLAAHRLVGTHSAETGMLGPRSVRGHLASMDPCLGELWSHPGEHS